jgi:hypothetical protein
VPFVIKGQTDPLVDLTKESLVGDGFENAFWKLQPVRPGWSFVRLTIIPVIKNC